VPWHSWQVRGVQTLGRVGLAGEKRVAVAFDRLRPPDPGLVVLLYHRVGRRSSVRVDLPTWLFAEQVARLQDGFGVETLDNVLARLVRPAADGDRPVAITFDDGTADFVDVALPILVAHGVPATLYLSTDYVERGRPFPDDGVPASWSALADALSTGLITIGSHTHTHALLDRLSPPAVAAELDRSIQLIGDRLGVEARHFAYPKAVPGSPVADVAVRRRFASAALAGTRPNTFEATDPYRLARSPIQVDDGLRFFAAKAKGGMRLEDSIRRTMNRRRQAGATS
jgi:peptidoglycan/xylan/chitin deacetylase (PgdA/CDA1 family)